MNADQELLEGARNAIRVCLHVRSADRVLILTDQATRVVGDALRQEALAANAVVECLYLEEFGDRPMTALPPDLEQQIISFGLSVTFLAISAEEGELPMRNQFARLVYDKSKTRHAHMPGITPRMMRAGMRVDYRLIDRITTAVYEVLRQAEHIQVGSARGSDLHGQFSGAHKWVPLGGLIHNPGDYGNLPEGEVFTCPDSVDGVLVAEVVGDYFSPKYGLLADPITIELEKGFARKVSCANRQLEKELEAYLGAQEYDCRVGEFAVGTNIGLQALGGNILQDEKMPGLHIALGSPPRPTGAAWRCETHVDLVPSNCTIRVDGELLMQAGRFNPEVLG